MNNKNKLWVHPELTVLVRRKPEEGILATCKQFSAGYEAANDHFQNCINLDAGVACGWCQLSSPS